MCQFSDGMEKEEIFPIKPDDAEGGKFSNLETSENFLDQLESLQLRNIFSINRKMFNFSISFDKSSTLPTLKKSGCKKKWG